MPRRAPTDLDRLREAGLRAPRAQRDREYNARRDASPRHEAAVAVHSSGRWKRLARSYLSRHTTCEACAREGRTPELATVCDHVLPVWARPDLAYAWGNLQALCPTCNGKKSGEEQAERRRIERDARASPPPAPTNAGP